MALFNEVGVVGAGAMGRGIAQIAAQAGSRVLLMDAQAGAARAALEAIASQWARMEEKGKLSGDERAQLNTRLVAVERLEDLAGCDLVIEAVVEKLEVKRELLRALEGIVRQDAALATNTSSLSVTAIGAALAHPERFAGYHFFNPVPLM
jgi:3-hydroxybutyryl-CoA dehydrogenase